MGYFEWLARNFNPPGIRAANRRRFYRFLGSLGDAYAADQNYLRRQLFALSCECKRLEVLGRAYDLPRWSFETDAQYRAKLSFGGFELLRRGSIAAFREFMNVLFGAGHWQSNGEAPNEFAVGQSAVGLASVSGIGTLRVGIEAIGAFEVGMSAVGDGVIDGVRETPAKRELERFLSWFLAADIAYEIYHL